MASRPRLDPSDAFEQLLAPESAPPLTRDEASAFEALTSRMDVTEHSILVKTIHNREWPVIAQRFEDGPFFTPTSLPPRGGRGMQLFGPNCNAPCGVCLDGARLGLLDDASVDGGPRYHAWPPGIFAKTEFNMDHRTGRPRASNVTNESCAVEALWACNENRQFRHFGRIRPNPAPPAEP